MAEERRIHGMIAGLVQDVAERKFALAILDHEIERFLTKADFVPKDTAAVDRKIRSRRMLAKQCSYLQFRHVIGASELRSIKNNTFIRSQWHEQRHQMKVIQPKLYRFLHGSFNEAVHLTKEYVPYSVWVDYLEKKYGFAAILRRQTTSVLVALLMKIFQPFVDEEILGHHKHEEVQHVARVIRLHNDINTEYQEGTKRWTKEYSINCINVLLSGLKCANKYDLAFQFVRTVCILFRRK